MGGPRKRLTGYVRILVSKIAAIFTWFARQRSGSKLQSWRRARVGRSFNGFEQLRPCAFEYASECIERC